MPKYLFQDWNKLSVDVQRRLRHAQLAFSDFKTNIEALAPNSRERSVAITQIDLAEPQVYAAILTIQDKEEEDNERNRNRGTIPAVSAEFTDVGAGNTRDDSAEAVRDSSRASAGTRSTTGDAANEQLGGGFGGDS